MEKWQFLGLFCGSAPKFTSALLGTKRLGQMTRSTRFSVCKPSASNHQVWNSSRQTCHNNDDRPEHVEVDSSERPGQGVGHVATLLEMSGVASLLLSFGDRPNFFESRAPGQVTPCVWINILQRLHLSLSSLLEQSALKVNSIQHCQPRSISARSLRPHSSGRSGSTSWSRSRGKRLLH